MTIHTPECQQQIDAHKKATEDWLAKWPDHCDNCRGGVDVHYQEHDGNHLTSTHVLSVLTTDCVVVAEDPSLRTVKAHVKHVDGTTMTEFRTMTGGCVSENA